MTEMFYIEYQVPQDILTFFQKQAEQKIEVEGWKKQGRNVDVKIQNFVHCWTTEEAFKQILITKSIWFRNRGLYFGDSRGAGADFTVKIGGKEVTIGLRSVAPESLERWKSVAYPDDRFREEKNKIADYHIVCNHLNGHTKFYGIISKQELLAAMEQSTKLYSPRNQEHFRVIPLHQFSFEDLVKMIEQMARI
ncbi:hypothetical protein COV17_00980 [Candidatus Woesearchaeota archaeon CG10_big_fil_rev_8_21_14_0_10_36_11]|nr:MAG: hypothetical protein COV17_00980 [Candidatus Woesearchaeota archaeon CG10_big_fil_rev_8_21_14_0_10_36_11]